MEDREIHAEMITRFTPIQTYIKGELNKNA